MSGNCKEKRVVEGGINTKSGLIRAVSAHESVNCFLVIVDFAKGEKVSLPKCLGEFPNRVAESFDRRGLDMFRRVDAETIKIEFCDKVLIGVDQNIQYRSGPYLARRAAWLLGVASYSTTSCRC